MSRTRKSKRALTTEDISFKLYEQLKYVLKDLARIDKMIPREISRIPRACCEHEADAIIVGRKEQLLRYVQIIARDHIHFGGKLIMQGWSADIVKRGWGQGNAKYYKPKGKFDPEKW